MNTPRVVSLAILWAVLSPMLCVQAKAADKATPLVIGETFTIDSGILGETRRINVYLPPGYTDSRDVRIPVLYMPDGGIAEDFLHVAGLVQVSVSNGTMRALSLSKSPESAISAAACRLPWMRSRARKR